MTVQPSKREQILQAFLALLEPVSRDIDPAPRLRRNGDQPERMAVGDGGLVTLRDGAGEVAEYVIGAPEPYAWNYTPTLELIVQDAEAEDRDPQLDQIAAKIGALVDTDRTLGGLCDWVEVGMPDASEVAVPDAAGLKGAIITVTIAYSSASPTG